MADPITFTVSYSFTDWQEANPSRPVPATPLDNQFFDLATSITSLSNAIKDVRRSDGFLKNGCVTLDSFDDSLKTSYTGGAINAWAPLVAFASGITAVSTAPATVVTYNGSTYLCIVDHTTTGTFEPAKWTAIATAGAAGAGSGDMVAANNLSDVVDAAQARANIAAAKTDLSNISDAATVRTNIGAAAQTALDAALVTLATAVQNSRVVTSGAGLFGGGDLSADRTISHGDTSTQASVNNSGANFIQDITLDTYGHVTAIGTGSITSALAALSAGAVSTYILAIRTTTTGAVTSGTTVAGSNLKEIGFNLVSNSGSSSGSWEINSALSGTWRCMADCGTAGTYAAGIWMRIS